MRVKINPPPLLLDIIYFGLIPLVSENNAKENKYIGSIAGGEQGYV